MKMHYILPAFEVVRNESKCTVCRLCERECANGVHAYDAASGRMTANDSKCVNCHRCVCACPTGALKIVESNDAYRANANWSRSTIDEIYRQAESGGVLLS